MSEQAGEKTEQATPRRLEEAVKRGQFARSAEVQTVFVLMAGMLALKFFGNGIWNSMSSSLYSILAHLHEIPLSSDVMQGYAIKGVLVLAACVGPLAIATLGGGLLAGTIQNRFQTASEAFEPKWDRLNPVEGLKKMFSLRSFAPALLSVLKLGVIGGLSYSTVKKVLGDPIFYTTSDVGGIAAFLAKSCLGITLRVGMALAFLAALDYAYQFWRTTKDMMMTKQEVKEEMKSSEGNPQVKAKLRRRRTAKTQRQMLLDVPNADVIVTNPTHIAIALRYDRKTMRAPKIVAKGIRLNALKIREIAAQHQVPIIENKPLARLMFKHGRVGGEVPAQLYAAVAEVLAWVYRVNRYRYYTEQNKT